MPPSNTNAANVVADAQWLVSRLANSANRLEFVHLPRDDHSKLTFLADQYLQPLALPSVQFDRAELQGAIEPGTEPCHFIFHSAFCCSTLVTRALDIPGASFGLNEPQILIQLAVLARKGHLDQQLLHTVLALLARPFGPGEANVVKPGNEANLLIEPILRVDERTRAVFLYAPLPRFLGSIARKKLWGRLWARRLFQLLRNDFKLPLGFSEAELFEQTDLQIAALAWLHHHAQFASLLSRFPGRLRALDSETFLARREESLAALGEYLELGVDASRWAKVAKGEVFKSHSKELGRSFSPEDEAGPDENNPLIDEEIAMVTSWAKTIADGLGLPLELPGLLDAAGHDPATTEKGSVSTPAR